MSSQDSPASSRPRRAKRARPVRDSSEGDEFASLSLSNESIDESPSRKKQKTARGAKAAGKAKAKTKSKAKAKAKPKAKAKSDVSDVAVSPPPPLSEADEGDPLIRLFSWNVNGARALAKKAESVAFLQSMIVHPESKAVGLQEIKCDDTTLPAEFAPEESENFTMTCNHSKAKKGYSGTWSVGRGVVSVTTGIGLEEIDQEGRAITFEFPQFYFVNVYVPNSSDGLKRLDERCDVWEVKIRSYLKELDKKKPVIYAGDLNVACSEMELANPKNNYNKSAGYTQREIDEFFKHLKELEFVDAYRSLYPDKRDEYTYWGYRFNARAKNIGWRMDYFLISKRLIPALKDVVHHKLVMGSDHCPIEIQLDAAKLDNIQS